MTTSGSKQEVGWAIHTRSREGHGFLGVWWFDPNYDPPKFASLRTALFPSRELARQALREWKGRKGSYVPWPKAEVVRVSIEIREES